MVRRALVKKKKHILDAKRTRNITVEMKAVAVHAMSIVVGKETERDVAWPKVGAHQGSEGIRISRNCYVETERALGCGVLLPGVVCIADVETSGRRVVSVISAGIDSEVVSEDVALTHTQLRDHINAASGVEGDVVIDEQVVGLGDADGALEGAIER